MKNLILFIITFFCLETFSQSNISNISPIHTGVFSDNNLSYTVGKIYVNQKKEEEKEKDEETSKIVLYPNPVCNFLTIKTIDKSEINLVTFSDLNGRIIFSNKMLNNEIDVSSLEQGVYIVIIDTGIIEAFRVIKK